MSATSINSIAMAKNPSRNHAREECDPDDDFGDGVLPWSEEAFAALCFGRVIAGDAVLIRTEGLAAACSGGVNALLCSKIAASAG